MTTTELRFNDPAGVDLHRAANRTWSEHVTHALTFAIRQATAALQRLHDRWHRYRHARATYFALSQLDSRTLRDLGMDRSEISSVAAELAGSADSTRVLVKRSPATARS